MERQWYDRSPYVNQSLFNPEWIYGVGIRSMMCSGIPGFANAVQMMAPTAPLANKQLIWHLYSAQAYG
jgi:hypothetical protein